MYDIAFTVLWSPENLRLFITSFSMLLLGGLISVTDMLFKSECFPLGGGGGGGW